MAPRWPHPDPRTGPCLAEEDYYEDDEEDDPDALKDPLYQIDLQVSPSSDAARRAVCPASGQPRGLRAACCCRAAWSRALPAWGLAPPVRVHVAAPDPASRGCIVTVLGAV